MENESFDEVFAKCRARLPLPELMVALGMGDNARKSSKSPFREESNPSFSMFESRKKPGQWLWKDNATGEGGTEIDLIMKREGYSNGQALSLYKTLAGIDTDEPIGQLLPLKPVIIVKKEEPQPLKPVVPYDWDQCKNAMTSQLVNHVAKARGIDPEFCKSLKSHNIIGISDDGNVAFPVYDQSLKVVVGRHVKGKDRWSYLPQGIAATPFFMGDIENATEVFFFESQWDSLVAAQALHWSPDDLSSEHMAFVATRGATNHRTIEKLKLSPKARCFLIPQNDPQGEKWVKDVALILQEKHKKDPFLSEVPKDYKDLNDWLRDGDYEIDIDRSIRQAKQIRKTGSLPSPIDASSFSVVKIKTPPELIKGVLHQGTKMVLGGPSKAYKTWAQLDLAISVATGTPWWDFECVQGDVMYLNFEIPDWGFQSRLETVLRAKGVKLKYGQLDIWNLRGFAVDFSSLFDEIIQRLTSKPYALIIIDPTYMILGERDENSSKDMNEIMNLFEKLCTDAGVAVAFAAHFAKGNASSKEAQDRISGSGVFARNPDSIVTLSPHSAGDDYFTADFSLRNLPRAESFVIRREHPLMSRCPDLDPLELKKPASMKDKVMTLSGDKPSKKGGDELRESKTDKTDRIVRECLTRPMKATEWQKIAESSEDKTSAATFYRAIKRLENYKFVHLDKHTKIYSAMKEEEDF